jgi:cytochrome d ubiquinol oxidase subunit I
MFRRSFRVAAPLGLAASVLTVVAGDLSGLQVSRYQPSKLAAMESHWVTEARAPFYLVEWPDEGNERNLVEALPIPGALSFLAYHDPNATVKGLLDLAPRDRPPVLVSFVAFRLMVALGFLFPLLALAAVVLAWKDRLSRWFLRVMVFALALPYLACELGWILAEMGRQPWIVYGLLRTEDAVSRSISAADVLISLVAFVVVYSALAAVDVFLLARYAAKTED